jgi:hypothetical protein
MRALQAKIVGRIDEPPCCDKFFSFAFEGVEEVSEHDGIGFFKIIDGEFLLRFKEDISIEDILVPFHVVDVVHVLKVHCDALGAIGDLDTDG